MVIQHGQATSEENRQAAYARGASLSTGSPLDAIPGASTESDSMPLAFRTCSLAEFGLTPSFPGLNILPHQGGTDCQLQETGLTGWQGSNALSSMHFPGQM